MTKFLTGSNFLNISPNELILFPTFLIFDLVYFKIYLKNFQTTFLFCFWNCVNSNIFSNRILGRERKLSKSFGVHPAFPHIEGKHSESRHNIFWCDHWCIYNTTAFRRTCYFMWYDHMHGCMLLIPCCWKWTHLWW